MPAPCVTREGLSEEHRFMAHLRNHGAPVPRVIPGRTGETSCEIDDWTYEVHEIATGIDLYEDAISWTPFRTANHARSTGEMMARLHLAAKGYDAPPRAGRPLVAGFTIYAAGNPAAAMEQYIAVRPHLCAYLARRSCAQDALALLTPFHQSWPRTCRTSRPCGHTTISMRRTCSGVAPA